ncbi:MAG: TonB-dependent receptor [Spongiibacteraceae bacterium]|nr:TonB-dependent receptor [Spongiibacteraceae bacterium]
MKPQHRHKRTHRVVKKYPCTPQGKTLAGLYLLSFIALAQAQTPADEKQNQAEQDKSLEEVVVTGIRHSLRSAMERKKNAGTVLDSIVAEDIASFPDKNVGEALQRITGVQITRDFGEGVGVSIRGVEPDLNRVEVNGVGLTGTNSSERGVDFREMASELIKSVDVIKGFTADMTEGGIGGTIKIETRSPLEVEDDFIAGSIESAYNDLTNDQSPRANITGIKKFNDKLGILLNVTAEDKHTMIHAIRNTEWVTLADYDNSAEKTFENPDYANISAKSDCPDTDCEMQWWDFSPSTPRYGIWEREDSRTSGMITVEYEFSDNLNAYIQGNYNEREIVAKDINLQVEVYTAARIDPTSVTVDENHNVIGLSSALGGIANRSLEFDWQVKSQLLNTGFEYRRGKFTIEGMLANSESKTDIDSRTAQIHASNVAGMRVDLGSNGIPNIDLSGSDFDVNDPSAYNFRGRFSYRPALFEKSELTSKLDIDYDWNFSIFTTLETGIQIINREDEASFWRTDVIRDVGSNDFTQDDLTQLISDNAIYSPGSFFGDIDLGAYTPDSFLTLNAPAFIAAIAPNATPRSALDATTSGFDVSEDTQAFYLKVNFETNLGPFPVAGNIGVRYIDTQVDSGGSLVRTTLTDNPDGGSPISVASDPEHVSIKEEYDDILPSINLTLDVLPDTLIAHAGYSKVMARPKLGDLAPRVNCTFDRTTFGVITDVQDKCDAGNPDLEPYRADQFDLGLSWYPDKETMVSLAVFYKDITNFIVDATLQRNSDFFNDGNLFDVTQKTNGDGAKISGFELSAQTPFTFIPEPFDGFGGIVNYTYSEAKDVGITNRLTREELPFPGLSEDSYNIILYYEKNNIASRLSYNYRSEYLSRASDRGGNPVFVEEAGFLDAKASYKIPGTQLKLFVEARNLTEEIKRENAGSRVRFTDLQWPGRIFSAGLSFKF